MIKGSGLELEFSTAGFWEASDTWSYCQPACPGGQAWGQQVLSPPPPAVTLSQACTACTTPAPGITAIPCLIQVFFIPELILAYSHE